MGCEKQGETVGTSTTMFWCKAMDVKCESAMNFGRGAVCMKEERAKKKKEAVRW